MRASGNLYKFENGKFFEYLRHFLISFILSWNFCFKKEGTSHQKKTKGTKHPYIDTLEFSEYY